MEFDWAGTSSQALAWCDCIAPATIFNCLPLSGSLQTRRPNRCPLYPFEREAWHASAPIRACHLQTAMSIRIESFLVSRGYTQQRRAAQLTTQQSSRCTGSSLDLPILLVAKPTATPLQRHYRQCHPARATPCQYDNWVQIVPTCSCSAHLSLCCRYVPGSRQFGFTQGIPGDELEFIARECLGRTHHLRNYGEIIMMSTIDGV